MIRSEISSDIFKSSVEADYPRFEVENPFPTFPTIFQGMREGDIPMVVTFEGVTKEVGRVSLSAIDVNRVLICCGPLVYAKSPTEKIVVNSIVDYLEVFASGLDN